eukprot:6194533-Pleurochrysis_carterae.AAC.3
MHMIRHVERCMLLKPRSGRTQQLVWYTTAVLILLELEHACLTCSHVTSTLCASIQFRKHTSNGGCPADAMKYVHPVAHGTMPHSNTNAHQARRLVAARAFSHGCGSFCGSFCEQAGDCEGRGAGGAVRRRDSNDECPRRGAGIYDMCGYK